MKHYGLKIAEGSEVTNLTAPTGTAFPTQNLNDGELFFRTDTDKLYVYNESGTNWVDLSAGGLSELVDDTTPQLGGTLDLNGFGIVGVDGSAGSPQTAGGDVSITAGAGGTALDGGSVTIAAGEAGTTGDDGTVTLTGRIVTVEHTAGLGTAELHVEGGSGNLFLLRNLNGDTDQKSWRIASPSGSYLDIGTWNDAGSGGSTAIRITRNATGQGMEKIDLFEPMRSNVGTAFAPSYSFASNSQAGLYYDTTTDRTGPVLSVNNAAMLTATDNGLVLKEVTAPTGDVTGYGKLYVDGADSNLKFRDDAGTVTDLTSGGLQNVVEDTTPQLGGDLDSNGFDIEIASTTPSLYINKTNEAANEGRWEITAKAAGFEMRTVEDDPSDTGTVFFRAVRLGNGQQMSHVELPLQAQAAAGNANVPAYSFTNDADSGMYSVGTSQLGFSTDNTNRLTIGTTTIELGLDLDLNGNDISMPTGSAINGAPNVTLNGEDTGTTFGGNILAWAGDGTTIGGGIDVRAGNSPTSGGNIDLNVGYGTTSDTTGVIRVRSLGGANAPSLEFREKVTGGSGNWIRLKAPDEVTSNRTWALPQDDPSTAAGFFLTTNASGEMSFATNRVIDVTDNTDAALRITQQGTGHALLVEDEANPDASPFYIDNAGNVVVGGDLTVNGTTTTVNTETILLADNMIVVNSNETGTPTQDGGIEVERGTATNVSIYWNETDDKWQITNAGGTVYDILTSATTFLSNVVEDTSPQAGGHFDLQNNYLYSSTGTTDIKFPSNYTGAGAASGVSITGQSGTGASSWGGPVSLYGGTSTSAPGGNATVKGGNGGSDGGDVRIEGGLAGGTSTGGDILLRPGYNSNNNNNAGHVLIQPNSNSPAIEMHFRELIANGAHYVGLKAPDSITASVLWTLPQDTHANANGKFLTSDASGNLSFAAVSSDLVNDTTPQLGGNLDVNGNSIVSTSNGNITLNPDGTGLVVIDSNLDVQGNTILLDDNVGLLSDTGAILSTGPTGGSWHAQPASDVHTGFIVKDHTGRNLVQLAHPTGSPASYSTRFLNDSGSPSGVALMSFNHTTGQLVVGDTASDALGAQSGSTTISTGNSGVTSVSAQADDLIVEGSDNTGISILSPNNKYGIVYFGDPEDNDVAAIRYAHFSNTMSFITSGVVSLEIQSDGMLSVGNISDYETLVTLDDDIPNKKYVDDAISSAATIVTTEAFYYTATASQTTFTGADDNGDTLAYVVGGVYVYLNGVLLDPSDYTATNGTSVVLDTGATLNDVVTIVSSASQGDALTTTNTARKNFIINGDFKIWQRGSSHSTVGYGSADRWVLGHVGATNTMSRQSFTPGQTDVPWDPLFYCRNTVVAGSAAGDYSVFAHRVEGIRRFSGRTMTLSFYAKADAAKNICSEFSQNFGTGGSPSTTVTAIAPTTHALTTSWQKFSVAVDIPSVSGKTFGTSGGQYLGLLFWFDGGTDFNSRCNSLGHQSGTFDIANVQLEDGPVSTLFEYRTFGEELALCQRFFTKSYDISTDPGTSTFIGCEAARNSSAASSHTAQARPFQVMMRTVPTVTIYNPNGGGTGTIWDSGANKTVSSLLYTSARVPWSLITTTATCTADGVTYVHYTADAEI